MGQTLYWECNSGISGDMAVASLLDLGADETLLRNVLASMPVSGFQIEISRVKKAGLDVCDFRVKLEKAYENHDDDMTYLFPDVNNDCGYDYDCEHRHNHSDDYKHSHNHTHNHETNNHPHSHRGLAQIRDILAHTDMSDRAGKTALDIFHILALAEAKAHGVEIEEVHFHEVGALDSIVDIVSVAVCLDNLDITEVIVPYLCEGRGNIRCQHGILPIPVPAVTNIVEQNGLQLHITDMEGELVTPTGAAIVAAVKTDNQLPDRFFLQKTGMGAGKRKYSRPSILRGMLICQETTEKDSIYKLETNIDDCTGEMLGYVMDLLLEHGARDVHYTPVFMKKNRPAYLLTVICLQENVEALENIIFCETTTIGIRKTKMERKTLPRHLETVQTSIGTLQVKRCILPDGSSRIYPEYETVAHLAREKNISLQKVLDIYHEENKDYGNSHD